MTDIICLKDGDAYEIFENYLTDLYDAQRNEEGVIDYCLDDLLVVWGLAYDEDDVIKMLQSGGAGTYPTLFEHDIDRWESRRLFYNVGDWCEGEHWAVVDAVYSISELSYVPGKGFDGRAMKLLGRDDRRAKQ